jgi:hypothetical protein
MIATMMNPLIKLTQSERTLAATLVKLLRKNVKKTLTLTRGDARSFTGKLFLSSLLPDERRCMLRRRVWLTNRSLVTPIIN